MQDKFVAKSEKINLKPYQIILLIAAALFFLNGAYYMLRGIISNLRNVYPGVSDMFASKFSYVLFVMGKHFASFIVLWMIAIVFAVTAGIMKRFEKSELILGEHGIYGVDAKGNAVQIPLSAVTGVEEAAPFGIFVQTAMGGAKFLLLKNRNALLQLLNARQ